MKKKIVFLTAGGMACPHAKFGWAGAEASLPGEPVKFPRTKKNDKNVNLYIPAKRVGSNWRALRFGLRCRDSDLKRWEKNANKSQHCRFLYIVGFKGYACYRLSYDNEKDSACIALSSSGQATKTTTASPTVLGICRGSVRMAGPPAKCFV
mgnify:CR=1 FL=1